jgi:hypothetical protein
MAVGIVEADLTAAAAAATAEEVVPAAEADAVPGADAAPVAAGVDELELAGALELADELQAAIARRAAAMTAPPSRAGLMRSPLSLVGEPTDRSTRDFEFKCLVGTDRGDSFPDR